MEIRDWDKRYRLREHAASDFEAGPTPLLMETAVALQPGNALDLASGAGRNSLWLAEHGWDVTAVDGAGAAIEILRSRAMERGAKIAAVVADLEKGEFEIEPSRWDLIAILYYLQRNLFEPAKHGVARGGILISIVHMNQPGEADGPFRLRPGEHENYFAGWEIIHLREGPAIDPAHRRAVSEIVARRPLAP
jgi:SAM-dependent methyltransferase